MMARRFPERKDYLSKIGSAGACMQWSGICQARTFAGAALLHAFSGQSMPRIRDECGN